MAEPAEIKRLKVEKECLEANIAEKDDRIGVLEGHVADLQTQIESLQMEVKTYKDKFNMLKKPELVRTEIEFYERTWAVGFKENKEELGESTGHSKLWEVRRQKWEYILFSSPHPHVSFLRKQILLDGLPSYGIYLSNFSEKNYEQLNHLTGYYRTLELINIKIKYLENIKKDDFLEAFLAYIENDKIEPTLVRFIDCCKHLFNAFAISVSEIYSLITDKVHRACFDSSDNIPKEYTLLNRPGFHRCITKLLSFYSHNPYFFDAS